MVMIAALGRDMGVLRRWTQALRDHGHECTVMMPGEAGGLAPSLCLFDLGSRGEADLSVLIDAIAAAPTMHFVAMTARPNAGEGLTLLRAGARGYCNRLAAPGVLNALVTSVEHGEIWAGKQVTDHLLQAALGSAPVTVAEDLNSHLTPREQQIAQQVAAGLSNKVIAAESGITERTVKAHLNSIFRKTGIRNRVQLALAITQSDDGRQRSSSGHG